MVKRIVFLFIIMLSACNNQPAPTENVVKKKPAAKPKASAPKPSANPWTVNSFAPKEGESEGRKYVKYSTEGSFSDSVQTNNHLYAEVFVDKQNGGIFLRRQKKSGPVEAFSGPVQVKMTNSSGQELQMTSTRSWNKSGGILIERNNNDYSQLRIFLLENKGMVSVEIKDSRNRTFNFSINTEGFSDSFSGI